MFVFNLSALPSCPVDSRYRSVRRAGENAAVGIRPDESASAVHGGRGVDPEYCAFHDCLHAGNEFEVDGEGKGGGEGWDER